MKRSKFIFCALGILLSNFLSLKLQKQESYPSNTDSLINQKLIRRP